MKRFAKLLSLRLDKIYIAALIITALQLLIGVIVNVVDMNMYSSPFGMHAIITSNNVILPVNYTLIISVVAAILVAVLLMHCNNPRFYLHIGVKKSENTMLSCANAVLMSVWVAMIYLISNVLSTAIIIGIYNDYAIINSVFETFNFAQILQDWLIVFLVCSCFSAAAMVMRIIYDRSKILAILVVGLVILVISLVFFGDLLPQKSLEYLSTFSGSATILAIINVIAFGGYALGEMLGEVKR